MNVKERFLNYVVIDSGSSETTGTHPSTERQWDMARLLEKELKEMGAENVRVSPTCYVYAEIPANVPDQPAIGLIAHMDTAPAVPTGPVHPRCLVYAGGELDVGNGVVMKPEEFECLKRHVGHELIVTDGTTLLGGDDKAGIAEIMTLCETLLTNPDLKHGKICVGFTPDEEIGEGADDFDIKGFGADFAYTVDGGGVGEYECENFNASSALVEVKGFNIHPGSAKGKMKNASKIAMEFNAMLPAAERPEHTEGREGFFYLCDIQGGTEEAVAHYIIRDHDRARFEARKALSQAAAAYLNARYGAGSVEAEIRDSYFNMLEVIQPHMHIVRRAEEAWRAVGVAPFTNPIRGGTDGARLSFEGLPCPNLGTGGLNFHGRFECIAVQDMDTVSRMLEELVCMKEK